MTIRHRHRPTIAGVVWRVGCTLLSIVVVEAVVCAVAALPVVLVWTELLARTSSNPLVRAAVFSAVLVPSYIMFALCLMAASAAATRLTGARTPPDAALRIAEMGWPHLSTFNLAQNAPSLRHANGDEVWPTLVVVAAPQARGWDPISFNVVHRPNAE